MPGGKPIVNLITFEGFPALVDINKNTQTLFINKIIKLNRKD